MTTTEIAPVAGTEGLSTQPAAPVAPTRGVLVPLRLAWRQLTSMRTALLLLFLLALAAVPGGFLPQRRINPVEVSAYLVKHPTLGPLLDKLSLYDVFSSAWFSAVYLLLFVSLVGCLGPRIKLHAKALVRTPPRVPATLTRLPVSDRWETDRDPDVLLADVRKSLRRSRWRTVTRGTTLSAEKGYLRETGNLVFHVSLVVLLIGIAVGAFYGFKGTKLVIEGDGFSNASAVYDDIHPGRRFTEDHLVPFNVTLDKFNGTYAPDTGKALTFDAEVTYAATPDGARKDYDVRVNHPLHIGAAKTYLVGHGYAPHVVVRDVGGNVALDQAVQCLPQDANFVSSCTIKVRDGVDKTGKPAQLAFDGLFTPTTATIDGGVTSIFPGAQNPALTVVGYRGDLNASTSTSIYTLAGANLTKIDAKPQALLPGQTWNMPGGGSITYVDTREWATFQVTQDPGKFVALGAAVGMVLGLLLSLFIRRRRLWVRITPAGADGGSGRSLVEVGGLARTDPETYAAEFAELTARLRATAPPLQEEPVRV